MSEDELKDPNQSLPPKSEASLRRESSLSSEPDKSPAHVLYSLSEESIDSKQQSPAVPSQSNQQSPDHVTHQSESNSLSNMNEPIRAPSDVSIVNEGEDGQKGQRLSVTPSSAGKEG